MRPSSDITDLAVQMKARQDPSSRNQHILFLGKACAVAAGVPSNASIARQVLGSLAPEENVYRPVPTEPNDNAWEQAFYAYLGKMSNVQRYRVLVNFYKSIPVPAFYQDLAALVKSGYFPHILTTNVDTLLEQALTGAGLWPGKDYLVISLGYGSDRSSWAPLAEWENNNQRREPITIIKLHGDLAQSNPAMGADEIRQVLEVHRYQMKGELSGDLVMVGYMFESPPVTQWLGYTPGELWWVSQDSPQNELGQIKDKRPVKFIFGESAQPQAFFGQLVYLLLRQSEPIAGQTTEQAPPSSEVVQQTDGSQVSVSEYPPAGQYSDAEYIRGQIRRNQQVLASLLQNVIPGETNVQLETQIEYQRRTIAELEDQLRNLSFSRERVRSLLQEVAEAVIKSSSDASLVSFIHAQSMAVDQAYDLDHPNQDIISAAIGAMVVLAERLGPQVVKPDLIHELASYAPSMAIKGVA